MSTQTEQAKWEKMADALGWEIQLIDMIGRGVCTPITITCEFYVPNSISATFRDAILAALDVAKQRTPLELAAEEMAAMMMDELGKQNCICRFAPLVGGSVPCSTCQKRELLKKAGIL